MAQSAGRLNARADPCPWLRKPGLVVVEFLPRIPAGRDSQEFMAGLERVVEDNSNRLMAEAGLELPESRG